MYFNEITYKEIERLTDIQLSDLLLRLLKFESEKLKFAGVEEILVPLKINVGDQGEDGRIKCDDTKNSRWVTNRYSIFQCKATNLKPQKVYDEFFTVDNKGKKILKPLIKEVLDAKGQYIFFINKGYNKKLIKARLGKAAEALKYCNKKITK